MLGFLLLCPFPPSFGHPLSSLQLQPLSLFLQLEVSQLEGSLQQPKAQSAMSPYLIPDTQALCYHLPLIRQLATSGRFIIIIPRTGKFIWEAGCRWRVLWDHCVCGQVLLLVNCSLSIGICAKHCCKRYGQVNEKLEWKRWVSC